MDALGQLLWLMLGRRPRGMPPDAQALAEARERHREVNRRVAQETHLLGAVVRSIKAPSSEQPGAAH